MENIRKKLKEACQSTDISELAKRMGYYKRDKFEKRLNTVLDSPDLALSQPYFDGLYSSDRFLHRLLSELDCTELIFCKALQDYLNDRPLLFVKTDFQKQGVSDIIMAILERERWLELPKSLKRMSLNDQCKYVHTFIHGFLAIIHGEKDVFSGMESDVAAYLQRVQVFCGIGGSKGLEDYQAWEAAQNANPDALVSFDPPYRSERSPEDYDYFWGEPVEFHCYLYEPVEFPWHLDEQHVLKFDVDGHLLKNIKGDVEHG